MTSDLASVCDDAVRVWLASQPIAATRLGFHEYDDDVPDLSVEGDQAERGQVVILLRRAEGINEAACDPQDRITRAVLLTSLRQRLEELDARLPEFDVGVALAGAPRIALHSLPKLQLRDADQAASFVRRCARLGPLLIQAVERLRMGLAVGRTPTSQAVRASIDELDRYLAVPLDDDSLVGVEGPAGWGGDHPWRAEVRAVVADTVRPALAAHRDFLAAELLHRARPADRSGLCWLPDGEQLYGIAVGANTTTDRTPEDIHRCGLDVLEGLDERFRALAPTTLGTTEPAETFERLRNDPALRFESGEVMRSMAQAALSRALARLPEWFGRLPSAPCLVREIPGFEAVSAPAAYYQEPAMDGTRPGTYWLNTATATRRGRYDAEATAFHEGVPGHHLQIALSLEMSELPLYRRLSFFPAYLEGWGLYAEALADEVGLYSDDLQRLGFLSNEAMRACRLVVDTGIHHLGWSRQRGIDFILEHTAWPEADVAKEVDRYISWPGQALAYMVGCLELQRLRESARQRLGTAFDLRAFHDTVLGSGALPLAVLANVVDVWVGAPTA